MTFSPVLTIADTSKLEHTLLLISEAYRKTCQEEGISRVYEFGDKMSGMEQLYEDLN